MGLTVYYEYRLRGGVDAARRFIHDLHRFAESIGFDDIHGPREVRPPDTDACPNPVVSEPDAVKWFDLAGTYYVEKNIDEADLVVVPVSPKHVIRFGVRDDGAETALLGLATYPQVVNNEHEGVEHVFETDLSGCYAWRSFCKTQYASLPRHGGESNFLRAHLNLVRVLDHARELGADVTVRDDSDYWVHRDTDRLLESVRDWNRMIASFTGAFKDAMGDDRRDGLVAPILEHDAFEHLEAEGLDAIERLRNPDGDAQPD